jgi:hypothetical protein
MFQNKENNLIEILSKSHQQNGIDSTSMLAVLLIDRIKQFTYI